MDVGTPHERYVSELASDMSKRISQSKPSTFNGKGEPSKLKLWLREFDKLSLVEKNVFAAHHLLRFIYIRSNKEEN